MDKNLRKALELDKKDPLKSFKNRFVNSENEIYLDGNSLGKLPKETIELTSDLIQNQWGTRMIRSWNEHWMDLPKTLAKKIAQIVGAQEDEIFVGDSTSLNLYKLVFSILQLQHGKQKIVTDSLNFPTDLYVLQGMVATHFQNHSIAYIPSNDGISISIETLENCIDKETALTTLSAVTYKSAFRYDMAEVNAIAKKNNSFVIWDLSHAAGAMPVDLNKINAELAVGCTYKYLNGGPGAPAFLYVKRELQEKLNNPISSWFAHEKPFDFDPVFKADQGIQKFAIGTPSILSLAAIEPGLDILLEAGIGNLREKSEQQSKFLLHLIMIYLVPLGFKIASPMEVEVRGSHISIQHGEAYRINRAMIAPKIKTKIIIPDFRPPNNIRLGIAPLYNSFQELYETARRIETIILSKEYEQFDGEKLIVT